MQIKKSSKCDLYPENNNISTLNLLWSIKKYGKNNIKFITTSTTGVYGQPTFKIPEGFVNAKNGNKTECYTFGNLGGSWYHITKSNDINNLFLASKLWNTKIIDVRTAIIYGSETNETSLHKDLNTRFDFDYYFGVVINRFCAMSVIDHNITIYGKGLLKRPFISLKDFVRSIINLTTYKQKNFEVFNQYTELLCIKDLGTNICSAAKKNGSKSVVKVIKNPRVKKKTTK